VKSVELLAPVHKKQLLTYLRLADKRLASISTRNNSVNTFCAFGDQANWIISFLSPNQGIDVG
jgi:hypothetical protein